MREAIRVDEQGFFVEDVVLQENEPLPEDCLEIKVPDGLYRPKFNGTAWEEGLTQEEIDAIKNAPVEPTQDEILQTDINAVAETTAYTLEDVTALAETVASMLDQITLLENEIIQLKGGTP